MDWGTSVWDTSSEPINDLLLSTAKLSTPSIATPQVDSFNDFDDFGETVEPGTDDFGDDFGDFGEGGDNTATFDNADAGRFQDTQSFVPPPAIWEPLHLDPIPPPAELRSMVEEMLNAVWPLSNPADVMTDEDIRQVEGLNQILVGPESRSLYHTLFNVNPSSISHPPNWIRSRTRRQHLISLGIPINLDEVMPHANGGPLPMLKVTTRPSSAPPGPRQMSQVASGSNTPRHAGTSRPGTPQLSGRSTQSPHGLGPKPKLNEAKVNEMLSLEQDSLSLLPLPTLEARLKTLQTLKSDTSAVLTYLLQVREALQQDSETYNGLIAELVGEAQKIKSGSKSRTGGGKRGSGI